MHFCPPSLHISAWDFGREDRCRPPGAKAREGEADVSQTTTEIMGKITPRPCHCSRLVRGLGRGTLQRASAETYSWVRTWMERGHSGRHEQPMQSPHVTECGWSAGPVSPSHCFLPLMLHKGSRSWQDQKLRPDFRAEN